MKYKENTEINDIPILRNFSNENLDKMWINFQKNSILIQAQNQHICDVLQQHRHSAGEKMERVRR